MHFSKIYKKQLQCGLKRILTEVLITRYIDNGTSFGKLFFEIVLKYFYNNSYG